MNKETLNNLMLEAGYAAPDIALRARKLAELVEAHVTNTLADKIAIQMVQTLHMLGYSGSEAEASFRGI